MLTPLFTNEMGRSLGSLTGSLDAISPLKLQLHFSVSLDNATETWQRAQPAYHSILLTSRPHENICVQLGGGGALL